MPYLYREYVSDMDARLDAEPEGPECDCPGDGDLR